MALCHTSPLAALWQKYSQEILLWQSVGQASMEIGAPWPQEQKMSLLQRSLASGLRAESTHYIMLGYDAAMVRALRQALAERESSASILILESQMHKVQCFAQELSTASCTAPIDVHLLVDSSPWALFMLTGALNLSPAHSTLIFCSPPKGRCSILEKWRKLFLGSTAHTLSPVPTASAPLVSLGVILHPNEPHLEDFFEHIPSWIHEVVVIWDGEDFAPKQYACKAPLRQFCRPLQHDFSRQRNTMLKHCQGDWVLYLDGDERLSPHTWQKLPQLLHAEHSGGVLFPRLTFEKDAQHMRMGHGLWPDVQLRLFPRTAKAHFINSIHEQITGLEGNVVLAPEHSILHYSHIQKSPEQLRQRLAIFNAAGSVEHTLSAEYPCLKQDFFTQWQKCLSLDQVFYLPV